MKPEAALSLRIPFLVSRSIASTASNKTGCWSFVQPSYADKTAPCSEACPCATDIPRVEMLIAQGKLTAAWQTLLKENPLPGVCGRVCFHPCETACNRAELDKPIAINALERAVADAARESGSADGIVPEPSKGKRVAIVGSGPAGLSAAYYLTLLGYSCDVFEADSEPGGLLRWGIPEYRLPAPVLEGEIGRLKSLGVEFHCGEPIKESFLADAQRKYAAVVLACGQGKSLALGVPGEELARDGLVFLREARETNGSDAGDGARVAVVGGGNSAIDTARTLIRMGKKPVIVYRRRRQDMPAFQHEVSRALEEGVELLELLSPKSLSREGNGLTLTLQKMKSAEVGPDGRARSVPVPGETETLTVSEVYSAIGAGTAESWLAPPKKPEGLTLARCELSLGKTPVAFVGDLTTKDQSVTDALASGKEAALALDVLFSEGVEAVEKRLDACRVGSGSSISFEIYSGGPRSLRKKTVVRFEDINADYFPSAEREDRLALSAERAVRSFDEVESGFDLKTAMSQAERCFNCGTCNGCDNCRTFCPDCAVILEGDTRRIDTDYCKGCGVCTVECPRSAMILGVAEGVKA